MSKKDKGKGIQKNDDYKIVRTKSSSQSLTNFPPLPYKTVATKPSQGNYFLRYIEHLFYTSYKIAPTNLFIRDLVQRSFRDSHHLGDHPQKTRQFYEPILIDIQSVDITHTTDVANPSNILYSKYIIKNVLGFQQWKDPLQERKFSIPVEPATYNYFDYKMAWLRAFFHKSEIYSGFFNFHDKTPFTFPIWFYDWWTMFSFSPSVLHCKAKEGWDFWITDTPAYDAYTKEAQLFRIFNIAWIFCWDYRYQNYLLNLFPLSIVRIYKVRWWSEYKSKLCGKKMLNIIAEQKPKTSPSKTFTHLTKL